MDQVYGNAYLTICAADGESAGAGLQIRNPERSPGSKAEKDSKEQSLSQNITRYNREIRLMSTQPAENYIRKSVWNTRGWTFQERLLSPRNLILPLAACTSSAAAPQDQLTSLLKMRLRDGP